MSEGRRVTLSDPMLRTRLRATQRPAQYTQRTVSYRRHSTLINDVQTKPVAPTPEKVRPAAVSTPRPVAAPVLRKVEVHQSPESAQHFHSPRTKHTKALTLPNRTAGVRKQVHHHSRKLARNKTTAGLVALAIVVFASGLYVSIGGWRANRVVQAQATRLTQDANSSSSANGSSSPAPSSVKPSEASIADYVVAPNLPRYLNIPKLGVHARVLSVGLTASGALGTPNNVYDTAWYNESAEPGQGGATLIDGHVASWTAHGALYGIKSLVPGDTIQVVRGDGQTFTYQVVTSKIYSAKDVDMTALMTPVTAGKPGLNLITCTGDVIAGTNEYNERIAVFAQEVGS